MPRRGYPPTQRWRTFLRNQAFAIGAIGLGEAGWLSDVVRGWIMRVGRRATKVRDGIPCRPIEPSSSLHPLWPYRSSNRAYRRFAQRRCVPGSSAVHTSKRHPLDLASRRLSPYRSRQHRDASCPAFANCTRLSAIARRAERTTILLRRLHWASATNNPKHRKSLLQKVTTLKACCYLAIPPRFGHRGRGYEERQVLFERCLNHE